MRRTALLFVALVLFQNAALAQSPLPSYVPPPPPSAPTQWKVDLQQLRKLACLPSCNFMVDVDGANLSEFQKANDLKDAVKRITALEKEMKGDATDAERFMALGELYDDDARCEHAWTQARELFKRRLQVEPDNGWLHAQYSLAICQNAAEAEAEARMAVRLAPKDWRCRKMLSSAHFNRMCVAFFGGEERVPWKANHSFSTTGIAF
jgi:hypothetical protein